MSRKKTSEGCPGFGLFQAIQQSQAYPHLLMENYVQDAIRKLGLTVEERNIWEDPVFEEELMSVTGRRVVPGFRVIDKERASRWIPESRDIIEYLVSRHSPA